MHETMAKSIKLGNLSNVPLAELYDGVWELVEENRILKTRNRRLTENYVKLFISNIEIMDMYLPQWRTAAETEIEQLKQLLSK